MSLGVADLVAGAIGGMPVCHGAGRLTAHRSFGARTGGAPLIMGVRPARPGPRLGAGLAGCARALPGRRSSPACSRSPESCTWRSPATCALRSDWLVAVVVGTLRVLGAAGAGSRGRPRAGLGAADASTDPSTRRPRRLMGDDGGMSAPVTEAPRKRPRGFETIRDMVLSMAVVGAVVLAVFWMVAWQRPEVQGPIRPGCRRRAGVRRRPGGRHRSRCSSRSDLPDGWTPTSAWFDPEQVSGVTSTVGVLHVGYLTPTGSYAEVQTDRRRRRAAAVDEWVGRRCPRR